MATVRQVKVYNMHKRVCTRFGITQATLKHKGLQGSLAAASTTGNRVYSGRGPSTIAPVTTDTAVWLATQPNVAARDRAGDTTPAGRQGIALLIGQIPAIDDNEAAITIAHDDLIVDMAGIIYRIADPAITPDNSLWSFGLFKDK